MKNIIVNLGVVSAIIFVILIGILSTVSMLANPKRCKQNKEGQFSVRWIKDGIVVGCVENVTERELLHEIGRRFFTSAAMVQRLTNEAKSNSTKSATTKMDYAMKDFGVLDVIVTYSGITE